MQVMAGIECLLLLPLYGHYQPKLLVVCFVWAPAHSAHFFAVGTSQLGWWTRMLGYRGVQDEHAIPKLI